MSRHRGPLVGLAVGVASLALVGGVISAGRATPTLPEHIPAAERARLSRVTEAAAVSTQVEGEPFVARGDVFEYLLDHPEFATHLTRALKLARYRIWETADGLHLDDGWGTTGQFWVVYVAQGTRVMYARGQYQKALIPTIRGEAVTVIDYRYTPAGGSRQLVETTVTGFVKLNNSFVAFAMSLANAIAQRKADLEARRLVRVFARASRAVDENARAVYEKVRERPDVPQADLEGFRALLGLQ